MSLKIVPFLCLLAAVYADQLNLGFHTYFGGRIVGGVDAEPGEFPYQISLQEKYEDSGESSIEHFCGGIIVNNYWILTAGHCVLFRPADTLYVKAGKHFLNTVEKTEQVSKVARVFVHQNFTGKVEPCDIALLKLETPLDYTKYVQQAVFLSNDDVDEGEAILSGWGYIGDGVTNITMPNALQKAKLPIIDLKTCREAIEAMINTSWPLPQSNMCTGPLSGGVSACGGDSGGPLSEDVEGGVRVAIGIVSYGARPCGVVGAPSVYTRISSFHDWMVNTMLSDSNLTNLIKLV